ncbi:MAG: amidohydrolase family protein [Phycisphaerae bacterium]
MTIKILTAWLLCATALNPPPDEPLQIPFDHHVHVLSPTLVNHWRSAGMTFSRENRQYTDPLTFTAEQGIERAFLISMAHVYATDEFGITAETVPDKWAALQQENDYVATCVAQSSGRFLGFFSVNPRDEKAIDEIERCRQRPGMIGLKLHLPACGVSLDDPAHVAALKSVLEHCAKHNIAVLIHLASPNAGFGREQARRFWREIVALCPPIELYCAHLGGAGGYNEISEAVLREFIAIREQLPSFDSKKIYFDLSGAILAEETDGIGPTPDDRCRALADIMRRVELQHFLFASDYPVFRPRAVLETLRLNLPLDKDELDRVLAQRSPRFEAAHPVDGT